jgi:NAD-dependent deacetylase
MTNPEARDQARELIASSQSIAVLTGAGISAESGVPTFRGEGGLWRGQRAESLATPGAFARNPAEVWEFYHARFEGLRGIEPNAGHRALAALEARCERFWLLTQNVDGLHRDAGSRNPIELHGSIRVARCQSCRRECDIGAALAGWTVGGIPGCTACGGSLRPAVVWFGEALPVPALQAADQAIRFCDAMLVVGTSGVVQPAASFAYGASSRGATVIEVNPEETPISEIADVVLRGPAAVELPLLLEPDDSESLSYASQDA